MPTWSVNTDQTHKVTSKPDNLPVLRQKAEDKMAFIIMRKVISATASIPKDPKVERMSDQGLLLE